ncbi:MAG: diguanylate cyclase, partial [Cellulosilyticaceae bacterium]
MDKKKINILILDLDKEMEDALKVQLQTDHIDTIFFATGRKVLLEEQVGEEKTYEMIVMPVKEKEKALAMLRRIKQHFSHKDIPIIGVFDKGCLSDLETFYEAGVTDWVEEPYTALQLAIRMKHHIAYIRLKNRSIDNEMLFQALLHNVPYMSWFKNTKSQYMKVNKELKYHCDKSFEDIQGRDDFYVWDGKIGEQCRLYDLKVMNERKSVIFNEMIPGKRGERLFEVHKAPVINAYDEVIGTVGIARDITEAVRAQQKIEQMAYMDDLTQLMNRRGMYRYFELLKEENIKEVTVFYLDLDNFKAINDSYGHYYGDQALVELANKLKSICAEGRIARLGGDEFVVVFPTKMTQEAFCEKATKLIDEGCMRFEKGETRHQVSVSIGIVQGNLSVDTMETLLIRSDLALYKAKEKGKNQYVVYTPQIEATYRKGLALEQAIYKGM